MKLLDQARRIARLRHLSLRTEDYYVRWIERYIRCNKTAAGFRHPAASAPTRSKHSSVG